MNTNRQYRMRQILKTVGRTLFALFFIAAAVAHFRVAQGFANMLPHWVPSRMLLVYVTGIMEFILAVLILIPTWSKRAGTWTAIYLVLIFPANIYAAFAHIPAPGATETPQVALWIRLAVQPLLIWWILWCTRGPGTRNV